MPDIDGLHFTRVCGRRCWGRTRHWVVLTCVGWVFAAFAMRQYRARVLYSV